MDNRKLRSGNRKLKKRTKSFTEALKEKYCMDDEPTFDFIIVSPKRKSNAAGAELAHLRTVVLNDMDVTRADIPHDGLTSLCPNVVDLDLANNLLESWHELIAILGDLPRVKYVNLSGNRLRLHSKETLPNTRLSVENMALNSTGSSLEEVVRLSHVMPALKELHLCGNDYQGLADIDRKISEGAFSALECMRLNNNSITSWSEVWKLRDLPQLKYLILSGNPIQDIFYRDGNVGADWSADTKAEEHQGHTSVASEDAVDVDLAGFDTMETMAEVVGADGGDIFNADNQDVADTYDEEEESFDVGDDSFCEGDDNMDKTDCSPDDRPVSRVGYHFDSDVVCSDDGSDAEQDWESRSKSHKTEPTISSNIKIPQGVGSKKKVHNTNFNNSRSSRLVRTSPLEEVSSSGSHLTPADLGLPALGMLPAVGAADSDFDEEDNPSNWPRLAAEQFLYDLIDQLDLGEAATTSTSTTLALSSSTTTSSIYTLPVTTSSSHNASVPSQSVSSGYSPRSRVTNEASEALTGPSPSGFASARCDSCSPTFSDINQNADTLANMVSLNTEEEINKVVMAIAEHADDSDVEEDLFARIYSDDDFIPRSVSMLNDDESYSPPRMPPRLQDILFSSSKSNAQRCLFGAPSTSVSTSSASCGMESPTQNPTLSERESDSCSDCEAEQHGLTSALRRELEEAAAASKPITGPGSWLDSKPSFTTSVRDSGEGYSITTTQTQGARVVVTGLDRATDENGEESGGCSSGSNASVPCSGNVSRARSEPIEPSVSPAGNRSPPFHQLQMLCLSNASVSHWDHLKACSSFPMLNNIRLKNNPLYSSVNLDDRRKLYIASLPKITVLNGGEVTATEREKAERFFLRFFMDTPEKPELYNTLVERHGPPVKLVDIDLAAGYQEWATLTFKCTEAEHFTRRLHLVEPVARLKTLVSQVIGLPKRCFMLYHHPCGPSHPECEREMVELRCDALPMSRFDFAEGDEIIIEVMG